MDRWDIKILYELDLDGRASISKIGKRIGKSKSFVKYRIEKLFERKIILDYITVFDTSKLGFQTYDIFIQIFSDKSKEKNLIQYLLSKKEINCIQRTIGKYQLYISIFVRNLIELENFFIEILEKFQEDISDYKILSIYRAYSQPHNYLFRKINQKINHIDPLLSSEKFNLDIKEQKLLDVIDDNPRLTLNEISKISRISLPNVKKKYEKLNKEKIILYTRPSLDATKIGFLHKILLIRFNSAGFLKINDLKEYLLKFDSLMFLSYSFGEYDLTGEFVFESLEEFKEFQEELFSYFSKHLQLVEYLDYFEEIKYSHYAKY